MRAAPLARTILVAGMLCLTGACSNLAAAGPVPGPWRAWLDSPGGELPFRLELAPGGDAPSARIVNGRERIEIRRTQLTGDQLLIAFDHYGGSVSATLSDGGRRLDGLWTRLSLGGKLTKMAFHAIAGEAPRFAAVASASERGSVDGRWRVRFDSDDLDAVGIFEQSDDGTVAGTFLTATGDYRYLAGRLDGTRLVLSCFDGAHAFLFQARLQTDGSLTGDFWSRDTWHEGWTARRDPEAETVDPFAQTRVAAAVEPESLRYPDLRGTPRSLDEPVLRGNAQLLVVFGSWCPNCNDASRDLVEMDRRYRDRGLSIVGLAFEMTGEFDRDSAQARRYVAHHGIEYPVLLAGTADKDQASEAFPLIDRVRAFPTLIFRDRNGKVRAVYSGYSGPATGTAHEHQLESFERILEDLLPAKEEGQG